ncbi:hypothetical protein B5S33_g880 [[Candida] boidinii]|nr:hypothetical protein B5S33_g880 [[Candida] boidinii]
MSSGSNDHQDFDERCWVCLGGKGERPPLGNYQDAYDWIHPCKCSLACHKKCFYDWFSKLAVNNQLTSVAVTENANPVPIINVGDMPNANEANETNNNNNNVDANNDNNELETPNNNAFGVSSLFNSIFRRDQTTNDTTITDEDDGPIIAFPGAFVAPEINNTAINNDMQQTYRLSINLSGSFNPFGVPSTPSSSNSRNHSILRNSSTLNNTYYSVNCPQCKRSIYIKSKTSAILEFISNLRKTTENGFKTAMLATLISGVTVSLSILALGSLMSLNSAIINTVAPVSVQKELFKLEDWYYQREISVDEFTRRLEESSRNSNSIFNNLKSTIVFTFTPFFLFNLRYNSFNFENKKIFKLNNLISLIDLLIQLRLIFDPNLNKSRKLLVFACLSKYLYKFIFNLTFNKIHYNLNKSVQTTYIADRLTTEEMDNIDRENQKEFDVQQERIKEIKELNKLIKDLKASNNNSNNSNHLIDLITLNIKLILKKTVPPYEVIKIKFKRFIREAILCFRYDYSKTLIKNSKILYIITTLSWPILGEFFATKFLKNFKKLSEFLNQYVVNTPDQQTFAKNLIGCFAVSVLKDFVNLFITIQQVKAFKNLDIATDIVLH